MGQGIDRRLFMAGAAAGLMTAPSALAAAAQRGRRDMLIVNALGGLYDPNPQPDAPKSDKAVPGADQIRLTDRVIADARASGMNAVNMTLGYVAGEDEPFEYSVKEIAQWDAAIRSRPDDLMKVLTAADIERARASDRIGLIYGFQNGAMMGDDASRVDIFANLGVRIVQLTYNLANQLGDGSMAPANRGLTKFGHEVVERLNANRLMVDLSHSGRQICLDAARASKQPISINHTGCRALTDLPRNKTDEELRLVASKGGFIGIYFMPFLDPDSVAKASDVVAHIDHAVNVCGEDHVGIGTDGGTTAIDDMAAYRKKLLEQNAARQKAGIAATGEKPDTMPFVEDLAGPTQFRKLADLLAAKGYKDARIEKILGTNFLRYARAVWGA